jgi:hypothetical protein
VRIISEKLSSENHSSFQRKKNDKNFTKMKCCTEVSIQLFNAMKEGISFSGKSQTAYMIWGG